jgi:transposase-like protein
MNCRNEGFVRNKTVYIALGILPDRTKEILGIRFEHTEGVRHNAEIFSSMSLSWMHKLAWERGP